MTQHEKDAATADAISVLKEHCENKCHAPHNMAISAYQDARVTLSAIEEQVCNLDVLSY